MPEFAIGQIVYWTSGGKTWSAGYVLGHSDEDACYWVRQRWIAWGPGTNWDVREHLPVTITERKLRAAPNPRHGIKSPMPHEFASGANEQAGRSSSPKITSATA